MGAIVIAFSLLAALLLFARESSHRVRAAPIDPPAGYPKLILSTKVVSPTLVDTAGADLLYTIEIVNTGAYTAGEVTLTDILPTNTTYNNDAWASSPPTPIFEDGAVKWLGGVVGFDSTVVITFSVNVTAGFEGLISNTAVISDPMIAQPVTVTAETRVTDDPLLVIEKTSEPQVPGANKPLTYLPICPSRSPITSRLIPPSEMLDQEASMTRAEMWWNGRARSRWVLENRRSLPSVLTLMMSPAEPWSATTNTRSPIRSMGLWRAIRTP
jgi:uncharacterized repeat protein (TIGR01451 family)